MRMMVAVSSLCLWAGLAQADLIAYWQNDALAGSEASVSANTLGANTESAVLGRGPGGTATAYANTFGMRNAHSNSLDGAIAGNRYLTVAIAAEVDYSFTLTNVFIRLHAQNATAYPVNFALFSDVTGFASGDELTTWTVGGTGNSADWLGQPRSMDLSGINLMEDLTAVEFRIYVWGQDGAFTQTGIGRAFQVNGTDDLVFTGNYAVVPEPGTLALVGAGLLSLALARRRRR